MSLSQRPTPEPVITPQRVEGAARLTEGVALMALVPAATFVEVASYPARLILADDSDDVPVLPLTPALLRRAQRRLLEGAALLFN